GFINRSNLQKVLLLDVAVSISVLENSVSRILRPHGPIACDLVGLPGHFKRSEEERAIVSIIDVRDYQWPAGPAAEPVFNLSWLRYSVLIVEKRIGVQDLITVEFKQASVEIVGAGRRDHLYLRGARSGIRMDRSSDNPELSNVIEILAADCEQRVALGVVLN